MKNILVTIVMVITTFVSLSAQTENNRTHRKEFYKSLSENQKIAFDSQKQLRKEQKSKMEATFGPDQLAIVSDKTISKRERRKSLMATLSASQKEMAKNHKEAMREKKATFEGLLTKDQLKKYKSLRRKPKRKAKE